MSQSNNFTSGFFLGALLGGVVGGVAGVLAANRMNCTDSEESVGFNQLSEDIRQNLADLSSDERMEVARRGLEDKISELNTAIEEVRQQLGSTNGHITDYETSTTDS